MVFTAIEESATDDGSGNLSIDLQGLRDSLFGQTHEGLTGTLSCDEFGDCAAPNIDILQNTAETADIAAVRANVLASYSAEQLGF
jgi:branched-chain amino acid transport system substrate-binding protein